LLAYSLADIVVVMVVVGGTGCGCLNICCCLLSSLFSVQRLEKLRQIALIYQMPSLMSSAADLLHEELRTQKRGLAADILKHLEEQLRSAELSKPFERYGVQTRSGQSAASAAAAAAAAAAALSVASLLNT
jgi:hypothetical protein